MSRYLLYELTGIFLFCLGGYGLIARRHLVHKVIGGNLMGSGVFLVLISLATRTPEGEQPDPVPQAMVLTGIVVTVALTALALALIKRYYSATGITTLDPAEEVAEE